jgi:hypothetical protein
VHGCINLCDARQLALFSVTKAVAKDLLERLLPSQFLGAVAPGVRETERTREARGHGASGRLHPEQCVCAVACADD